jgi:alanine-glyoxylate transaminase/serine-glyoxylate transaminase/serine-pyruvate transaminase
MTNAKSGRHFLQIPGPTNVPDAVLRAIDAPTIDHRGPDFRALTFRILQRLGAVFGTTGPVVIYPASGTGAWEAALVNTLDPGAEVLCFETGHFSTLWADMAERLGLQVTVVPGDWRRGVDPDAVADRLAANPRLRAVMVVHNETSTGVTSRIADIRAAIDSVGHNALLLVDTISSLGSIEYRHHAWGVDVTVAGSQKGLMLPPGLSFNALSERALEASRTASLPRSYWDWAPMLTANAEGQFPYTPATNLLYGLDAALDRLEREGMEQVLRRHRRHAEATRAAVHGWGLEVLAVDPREYSSALTAVLMPNGVDAEEVRGIILDRYDMSLGAGLGRLRGRVFRIGHLGDLNDLTLAGTLAGVQMGLRLAGVPVPGAGLDQALERLQAGP